MKLPFYSPVRSFSESSKNIFLTFDDGPSPELTPKVLEVLKSNKIQATFFVVVKKALQHPELVRQIIADGHSIGDHSLDHKYSHYFSSREKTREWVLSSQLELEKLCAQKPVAFRSPAGIWTPKLALVLRDLKIPWVHWNIRFFDTSRPLTKSRVDKKLKKIVPGSIVLLHDSQNRNREETFLTSLEYLIRELKSTGLSFEKLVALGKKTA